VKALRQMPKALSGRGNGEECFPPQPTRRSGGAPPVGSMAEPQPKTNLVHFMATKRALAATVCLISVSLDTDAAER